MDNSTKRMKVDVMTMAAEDSVQLALDRYDEEPKSKDPSKLLSTKPLDLVPVDKSQISKKFSGRKSSFVDASLGEVLNLGLLAQFFRQKDNELYDVVLSVEDTWNAHRESIISDGAIKKHDQDSRMIVQQVMAQDIAGKVSSESIEDEAIKRIEGKNEMMKNNSYPEKSALLISIYSNQLEVNIKKIIAEADLTVFSAYYLTHYQLPQLDLGFVVVLGGSAVPAFAHGDTELFALTRHENPYGPPENQNISSSAAK